MTKYFELVPVTVKPEKDDWYYVTNPNGEILPRMIEYRESEGWRNFMDVNISHYLRPLETLPGNQWVKASDLNYEGRKTYFAKFYTNDGKEYIRGSGYFQFSDGLFFWHEKGFVPIEKKLHNQLFILDESPSPLIDEVERLKGLIREAYEQGVHDSYTRSNKYFEDFSKEHNL